MTEKQKKISWVVSIATGVLGFFATWVAMDLPRPAWSSEVRAVDSKVDREKVCRLRSEMRRLELDKQNTRDQGYIAWLDEQMAANVRELDRMAKRGVKCHD